MSDQSVTPAPSSSDERPRPERRTSRRALLAAGGVLLAAGLGGSAYVAWELFADPLMDPAEAAKGISDLKDAWEAGTPDPFTPHTVPGTAIALLRIPDFGADFEVPVVYGTTNAALSKGVGWFESTAKPGEIGNFAVAGHRGSHGPFVKLPGLAVGARVEVETREALFVYALDNHPADTVVLNSDTWVLDPVPGQPPTTKPTVARITLITCAELFHAPDRAVAFGHLVESAPSSRRVGPRLRGAMPHPATCRPPASPSRCRSR